MKIIPVIDLLNGQVVHAQRGQRNAYAPLVSPLCADARPESVVSGLLSLAPFRQLYIADLNAIQQQAPQWALLCTLIQRFPHIQWWVDSGLSSLQALEEARAALMAQTIAAHTTQGVALSHPLEPNPLSVVRWVLGSETFLSALDLPAVAPDCVLSLDFGPEGFRGDPRWLTTPHWWPNTVVVMSLARVGAQEGPDVAQLRSICAAANTSQVFAAGGVRHADDVKLLCALGVTGALVATALHQGGLRIHPLTAEPVIE
jgi:phosphoribosylformimino-5-aminoimidazole carboxamide ribotide isomerase